MHDELDELREAVACGLPGEEERAEGPALREERACSQEAVPLAAAVAPADVGMDAAGQRAFSHAPSLDAASMSACAVPLMPALGSAIVDATPALRADTAPSHGSTIDANGVFASLSSETVQPSHVASHDTAAHLGARPDRPSPASLQRRRAGGMSVGVGTGAGDAEADMTVMAALQKTSAVQQRELEVLAMRLMEAELQNARLRDFNDELQAQVFARGAPDDSSMGGSTLDDLGASLDMGASLEAELWGERTMLKGFSYDEQKILLRDRIDKVVNSLHPHALPPHVHDHPHSLPLPLLRTSTITASLISGAGNGVATGRAARCQSWSRGDNMEAAEHGQVCPQPRP